eukprot:TRINITY_DN4758_c0_g1_i1.p1 TRINITY_DN4758_c0_g1~~TRINITY_DN4758_c0_g1_i1.p1  ORF type:complete len:2361 (-),score=843.62 TRINITY_DN4758_c0_g1_i1:69-7151(-)
MVREMPPENFTRFLTDLNTRISTFVNNPNPIERMAAVLVIEKLIDIDYDVNENADKIQKFGNYLRVALTTTDNQVLYFASKSLGHLVRAGGKLTEFSDTVDNELKRSLDWLRNDKTEYRRYAAVLVLKELAISAPVLFNVHVSTFIDLIWSAFIDPSILIREAAVDALRACLDVVEGREHVIRFNWCNKLWNEAQNGLKQSTGKEVKEGKEVNPVTHGALLVIGELLIRTGDFMTDKFKETADILQRFRDSNFKAIKRTIITLVPRLALYNPDIFVRDYLNTTLTFLLTTIKKEEKGRCYLSIGEISMAVGANIKPHAESILTVIKAGLKGGKKGEFYPEALTCLGYLSVGCGSSLRGQVEDVLPELFNNGLSKTLTASLKMIGSAIPASMASVQQHLLDHLALTLGYQVFTGHFGNGTSSNEGSLRYPKKHTGPPIPQHSSFDKLPADIVITNDDIALALEILGTFDFVTNTNVRSFDDYIVELMRDCVANYLDHEQPNIRKQSAACCTKLIGVSLSRNGPTAILSEVLERLLVVEITDQDASIRRAVLAAFDPRFDTLLARPEMLKSLFLALNDEVFEVKELAITIIGRLTILNPAHVMPSLRKTLIQLLLDMQYSGDSRRKEESARLLAHLIKSSHRLIGTYVKLIMDTLLPKLQEKDGSSHVTTCVLAALAELSIAAVDEMKAQHGLLIPLILETLMDQSSVVRREGAFRTLRKFVSHTGYVVQPYFDYPKLIEVIHNEIRGENDPSLRMEVMKTLGTLGALDPVRFGYIFQRTKDNENQNTIVEPLKSRDTPIVSRSTTEGYYHTVAIGALVKIMRDPSLTAHYRSAIESLVPILKSLGLKCAPFLPMIMRPFLHIMRNSESHFKEWLFQELGVFISISKIHMRVYLDEIFAIIRDNWYTGYTNQILSLIEDICTELNDEFRVFLPSLIPKVLKVLQSDNSSKKILTRKVLHALETFGVTLEDYLHLVIPAIVTLLDAENHEVTILAIQSICRLSAQLNFSDYASQIVHPMVRMLDTPLPDPKLKEQTQTVLELRRETLETLCQLLVQLASDYAIFIPMVNKVLVKNGIVYPHYETLVSRLMKNQPLNDEADTKLRRSSEPILSIVRKSSISGSHDEGSIKLRVNTNNLKQLWETGQRSTREDWAEWIRRFSVGLLRESPSPALRSCITLANEYFPLVRDLFNAGFISCWSELDESLRENLIDNLKNALESKNIPREILQTLLNLAEFMEHEEKSLPIHPERLAKLAEECSAYAKSLYYKEQQFQTDPNSTIESLISLSNKLGQPSAADGLLRFAKENYSVKLKETWYEKLNRWDDALATYQSQFNDPSSPSQKNEALKGQIRCLHALGEWKELEQLAHKSWGELDTSLQKTIAPYSAIAAWNESSWEAMEKFVMAIDENSVDRHFYESVLATHYNQFERASTLIGKTRTMMDAELTALMRESYNRAYKTVVRVQQLTELEEVIQFKTNEDFPERRQTIKNIWKERLTGCQQNVDIWNTLLSVRSMVLSPSEESEMWLKFASLCRKSGRLKMAGSTLESMLNFDRKELDSGAIPQLPTSNALVSFAYLKHCWELGKNVEAFNALKAFAPNIHKDDKLKAQAFQRLGQWQTVLEPLDENSIPQIIASYSTSVELDPNWYGGWHSWAMSNFDAISYYEKKEKKEAKKAKKQSLSESSQMNPVESIQQVINQYLINAIRGFFRSIALSSSKSLQDTLRILTLWFKYAHVKEVETALIEGFSTVPIDTWLQVVPQLIARIASPITSVRRLVHELLINVGKEHPQALVFPLNLALKSQSPTRVSASLSVIDNMRKHANNLVEQALMVSQELVRVAIVWYEMWHEGLEDASRFHFAENNPAQAIVRLKPLHEMMLKGPETLTEIAFQMTDGRELAEAAEWTARYEESGKIADFNQAWDLYYGVFKHTKAAVGTLGQLNLEYVSPRLLTAKNLDLVLPGSYRSNQSLTKIQSFNPRLDIIPSKQRPRKLGIFGSDGVEHSFLLKGHEDLRQDERVMQLFGLVNALLRSKVQTQRAQLKIERYAVVPLTPNSGLIGWVPHCDTLFALIKEYREARKIHHMQENRLVLSMSPDYQNLPAIQKIEIFKSVIEATDGKELKNILWQQSSTAESWLERRTTFTRSLATMSMVGYILGLGDRHCSNLMLDRLSGKIIHIDFGDCFEVAMNRDKFPERVPFRLTRMLVNAMGVSGIEGNFRTTCENVMEVLRENRESLMAVLEAFVYDPLIGWRLIAVPNDPEDKTRAIEVAEQAATLMEAEERDDLPSAIVKTEKLNKSLSDETGAEDINSKAMDIIGRIQNKLTGKDFKSEIHHGSLQVGEQVDKLIQQATNVENLALAYLGWSPYW